MVTVRQWERNRNVKSTVNELSWFINLALDEIRTKMKIIKFIFVEIRLMNIGINTEENEKIKILRTVSCFLVTWNQDPVLLERVCYVKINNFLF